ncbi:MAG: hypothetical protein IPL67_16360 [Ignavibacteria bacterium]|nr:hypothetical protein [Ignavibacteria bacterium]
MSDDSNNEEPGRLEEIEQENALLKMKLTAEFGMTDSGGNIDPEIENAWLKNIYEFEKSFAEHKRIKIYDYIGRPEYRNVSEIPTEEVATELDRVMDLLLQHNIELSTLCDYEDDVIYKFITEELFQLEIDEIRIEGMMTCFIYEEFYPNYEYDLRNHALDFIHDLLSENLRMEFFCHLLEHQVEFQGSKHLINDFSMIVMMFRESCGPFSINDLNVDEISFSLETGEAIVNGRLSYNNSSGKQEGPFELGLKLHEQWWTVSRVVLPGFGGE